MVCISTEESFFILKYNAEAVTKALQTKENLTEDGVEDAFDVVAEIQEIVKTGERLSVGPLGYLYVETECAAFYISSCVQLAALDFWVSPSVPNNPRSD